MNGNTDCGAAETVGIGFNGRRARNAFFSIISFYGADISPERQAGFMDERTQGV